MVKTLTAVLVALALAGCGTTRTVTTETTTTVETTVETHTVVIPPRTDTVAVRPDTVAAQDTVETYSGTSGPTTVQVKVNRKTKKPVAVVVQSAKDSVTVQDVDTTRTVTSTRVEDNREPGFFAKLGYWVQGIGAFVVLAILAVVFLRVFRKGALWPF